MFFCHFQLNAFQTYTSILLTIKVYVNFQRGKKMKAPLFIQAYLLIQSTKTKKFQEEKKKPPGAHEKRCAYMT